MRPLLALTAIALAARASAAQGCLPTDEHAQALREYGVVLATDTSAKIDTMRVDYGLVRVPASEVQIVTDKQVCATAARRFDAEQGEHKKGRLVYVVRVGTRYIVTDPKATMGEFQIHVVYDKNFKRLAGFAG